jgi:hypothetical protein
MTISENGSQRSSRCRKPASARFRFGDASRHAVRRPLAIGFAPVTAATFEYMRLVLSFRGCEAIGPGSEKFSKIEGFDAMLAALGADAWELVLMQGSESEAKTYLFKRPAG